MSSGNTLILFPSPTASAKTKEQPFCAQKHQATILTAKKCYNKGISNATNFEIKCLYWLSLAESPDKKVSISSSKQYRHCSGSSNTTYSS